jgi:hypothetical protein
MAVAVVVVVVVVVVVTVGIMGVLLLLPEHISCTDTETLLSDGAEPLFELIPPSCFLLQCEPVSLYSSLSQYIPGEFFPFSTFMVSLLQTKSDVLLLTTLPAESG